MVIPDFFGAMSVAKDYPMIDPVLYAVLDALFFLILAISFFLYYRIYKYTIKHRMSKELKDTLRYLILTLVFLNIIFVGIIIEFIYIRNIFQLYLPMASRFIWLVLSLVSFCLILKAYFSLGD